MLGGGLAGRHSQPWLRLGTRLHVQPAKRRDKSGQRYVAVRLPEESHTIHYTLYTTQPHHITYTLDNKGLSALHRWKMVY